MQNEFTYINRDLLEINSFLVFDAFNEKIMVSKYYEKNGKQIQDPRFLQNKIWKDFGNDDFISLLENGKTHFNDTIDNFCGVLEENWMFNELPPEENNITEIIKNMREMNMFKIIQEEVFLKIKFFF